MPSTYSLDMNDNSIYVSSIKNVFFLSISIRDALYTSNMNACNAKVDRFVDLRCR
jgi:hypothetical protein